MNKLLSGILCLILLLGGCHASAEQSDALLIEYTNLLNVSVCEDLSALMTKAGISDLRQQIFFRHVDQFNNAVSQEGLAKGFEQTNALESRYDSYVMQDEWNIAHPEFLGYNCRITAFSLFGDFVEIPGNAITRTDMVMMDMVSLDEDPSALLNHGDYDRFLTLFSTIPTVSSKDILIHVENLQKDWSERGITFLDQSACRLISVVFHDTWDGADHLFIGHIGVLFPVSENELYFVEKIAFQEPYQLTIFQSRSELNDYLMAKYNVSSGQPTAAPFIMENNELMEGYQSNR